MNDIERRCASCCAATEDGADCMNLRAEFSPASVCELHETSAEFDADMAALHLLRRFTQPGKPGAKGWGAAHD